MASSPIPRRDKFLDEIQQVRFFVVANVVDVDVDADAGVTRVVVINESAARWYFFPFVSANLASVWPETSSFSAPVVGWNSY